MEVVIIANGEINDLQYVQEIIQDRYIICADGAAKYLRQINMVPDLLVGDFDSISSDDLLWMKAKKVNYEKFPPRKDQTDTELALEYAFKILPKPRSIVIVGGLGSRWDHSLANIMLLNNILDQGIEGKIISDNDEIILAETNISINGEIGELLSIIPLTSVVKGITLEGLEYPLQNRDIKISSTLGISNVFTAKVAKIFIEKGRLLIIKTKE